MHNYKKILQGIEKGLWMMRNPLITEEEFEKRLDSFKAFNYKNLTDDDIFWTITYVMFFNIGKKASMIEEKLPLLKEHLYSYKNLAGLSDSELANTVAITGFDLQITRSRENAKKFSMIIEQYGSFDNYLTHVFGIEGTDCPDYKIELLYYDLQNKFIGIGETAGWHILTELGFNSLKPDAVIKRIFHRLGLISDEQTNMETIEVGREFSKQLNLPIRYIDIVFVKFGQKGSSDLLGTIDGICLNDDPKCRICPLVEMCRYRSEEKENGTKSCDKEIVPYQQEEQVVNAEVMEKDFYLPQEFYDTIYYRGYSEVCRAILKTLFESMKDYDIDFLIQKRKNNDIILVASNNMHKRKGKNIITVWTHRENVEIQIFPEKRVHFSILDLDEHFFEKVKSQYQKIIG